MNRIQEALMHLHKIVMFVPDEVQDELGEVERLLKEKVLDIEVDIRTRADKSFAELLCCIDLLNKLARQYRMASDDYTTLLWSVHSIFNAAFGIKKESESEDDK